MIHQIRWKAFLSSETNLIDILKKSISLAQTSLSTWMKLGRSRRIVCGNGKGSMELVLTVSVLRQQARPSWPFMRQTL